MAYSLFTKSFGLYNANTPVRITEVGTGLPATILASESGGLVTDQGISKTDAQGELNVYIDTARNWDTTLINDNLVPDSISYTHVTFLVDTSIGATAFKKGQSVSIPDSYVSTLGKAIKVNGVGSAASAVDLSDASRLASAGFGNLTSRDVDFLKSSRLSAQRVAAATSSIWFPLNDRQNSVQVDSTGTIAGNVKGGNSLRWGVTPGMTFNGTNHRIECNSSLSNAPKFSSLVMPAQNGFTHATRHCSDLASLATKGDMILAWAVITHATPIAADMVVAGFGMNADPDGKGGWAFGIKSGTSGKVQIWHRGVGGSATDVQPFTMDGITGRLNDNTRTAFAIEMNASPTTGLIEARSFMMTLGTDGGNAQNNVGVTTPAFLTNGATAACGPNVNNPLTIGTWCNSVPFSNNAPAGTISTGNSGHLTLSADFGATGSSGLVPYTQGVWLWFGSIATTPAITAKLYWCVFSTLRVATIYSNGPGSAPLNFTVGSAYSAVTPNFVNFFQGTISQVGIQRRPKDFGLGMRVVRNLRDNPLAFPSTLAG